MRKIQEKLFKVLEELEQQTPQEDGYDTKTILTKLGNNYTEKYVRKSLRLLISAEIYPEFKTAGKDDIVYCPEGKGSGKYRLSKYRK